MTERVGRALRVATVVMFVVVLGLLLRFVLALGDGDDGYTLPVADDAYTVVDAIAVAVNDPIAVRGYVFDGDARELRLCATRADREGGGPPRCVGPFLSLKGVDAGAFVLERGESTLGEVRWSADPVTLYGTLIGTEMQVQTVLADE